ncbi:uncharacterized protein LOC131630248 isoform X3 [Vicia villosa]|uniref:uncharacterized protein LOC131630248 isoform X3 n=1 Tax=Vicia villosa TaxID=3911 RepID=UPI00273BDA3D|nr:uncharacterized protein LOC131630248 isoform X3 [Vicia villosa]
MSLSYSNFFLDDDLLYNEETSSILSRDLPAESFSYVDLSPPSEEELCTGCILLSFSRLVAGSTFNFPQEDVQETKPIDYAEEITTVEGEYGVPRRRVERFS